MKEINNEPTINNCRGGIADYIHSVCVLSVNERRLEEKGITCSSCDWYDRTIADCVLPPSETCPKEYKDK